MYKPETLKKLTIQLKDLINKYHVDILNGILPKISISTGNRKIGRVLNVSTAPIICCGNCKNCKGYCYDVKACLQYKNVRDARARNTALVKYARDVFFKLINEKMDRRKKNKYFRYQVSGDILDYEYFDEMVNSAKRHPDFEKIWTYTKMYHIVNTWIKNNGPLPSNFIVMFSEWDGVPMDNPYNLPVFVCKLKNGNKNRKPEDFQKMYRCPGNCDICKKLNRGCIKGEDTYSDEH